MLCSIVLLGSGPFPGLTDMFGGLVSLVETRAALLASHGYATYAISYLYSEGLPQNLMGASEEYIRVGISVHWFYPWLSVALFFSSYSNPDLFSDQSVEKIIYIHIAYTSFDFTLL